MNLDEFENKLRNQSRREIPPEWRREILGPLRGRDAAPLPWWRNLLWPHPAAWGTLGAAWVVIFILHFAGPPEQAPALAVKRTSPDMQWAYQERKRLWAELALDTSPQAPKRAPVMDRPRSHHRTREAVV